jgi:methyl-accepting chemotaxis protein
MHLKTKFQLNVALAGVTLLALSVVWVVSEKAKIMHEKQEQLKRLVDEAYSVAYNYYEFEQTSVLNHQEAQQRTLEVIGALRYGDDGNYLWVNDLRPVMVMHPINPDLDGKDLSDYKDATGKAMFVEMVDVVNRDGAGFVPYMFPKPGQGNKAFPKLSYVKEFKPWGWVIGTGIYVDDVDADWHQAAWEAALITLASLALLLLVSTFVSRSIFRRLREIVERIHDVTRGEGDLTRRIPVNSEDEVGEVAKGFNTFIEQVQSIVSQVADNAQHVAAASEEFSSTSQQITANSEETSAQANTVSTATEEVSRNLQTVATGAEEMSATIKDVAKNAGEAAKVASEAVASAKSTTEMMSKLDTSSNEIGQVVKLITTIAQQTNLLALNATIEAARAGEAGKGFAVVANEVKELAKQTAKATEEISQKIKAIQEDTKGAVEAIGTISGIINRINDISTTIATAVEEQSATTNEMSRNVTEAAKGSEAITQNISGVTQAAQSTSSSAHDSQKAAAQLAEMSTRLRQLVEQFKISGDGNGNTPSNKRPVHRAA